MHASLRSVSGQPEDGAIQARARDTDLRLLPERAAWLADSRTLLVADVHLGKAATFRSLGVPVPGGTTEATLARLSALIARHRPRALYVLGDLLHGPVAQRSAAVPALSRWRAGHADVQVALVRGNHDDRAGDPPAHCGIDVIDEGHRIDGFVLCHAPRDDAGGYVLAGHLHPAFRLSGRVGSVRLPCFWLRAGHGVLPAFGDFTGGWSIPAQPGDQVFVTDDARVHRVPLRPAPECAC